MSRLSNKLPFLVFAVTAAIGLVLPIAAYRSGAQANHLRFERLADEAVDRISLRVSQHVSLLFATRSLFEAQSGNVGHLQFASFVEHLQLEERHAGIQGIGFATVVPPGGEKIVRERLRASYGIDRAPFPEPGPEQQLRTAIVMLEPPDERNRAALGYDMYSEEVRRAAMHAAMLSGEASATGGVELVQEINSAKQAGFLIYLPLFNDAGGREAGEQGELRGFIYAPFRIGDLVRAALGRSNWLPVHLEIHDGGPEDGALLYKSASPRRDHIQDYTIRRTVNIAGRQWGLMISPSEGFREGREMGIALILGAVSLLMAAALAVSMRSQLKALEASREVLRVTEAAAGQKDFLLQEMKHRIKNSIARVLAISRQTARHSETLDEFTESFTNRLQAMAASQDLLTRSRGEKADLEALLDGELQQVFGSEFAGSSVSGPRQELGVRTTQALALVIHELATNALKYAGLDEPGSRLEIRWSKADDGRTLMLDWTETGTSALAQNGEDGNGGGFGTRLMRSLVEGELSGKIEHELGPGGLRAHLEIPDPGR